MNKTPGQILWEAEAAFHGVDASHYEFVDDADRVRQEQLAAAVWNAAIEDSAIQADTFAKMMEDGCGECEPGERLRQLARYIRAHKVDS